MVTICMLGKFEIQRGHAGIGGTLHISPKERLLLIYLLLNRDRPATVTELCEAVWGDAATGAALRPLVSRVRSALVKWDAALSKCIIFDRDTYRWNPEMPCEIDLEVFEAQCDALAKVKALTPQVESQFEDALAMYGGDLARQGEVAGWLIARSAYAHSLYLDTVYRFVRLLKAGKQQETIIRICQRALDVDAMDKRTRLEYMEAMVAAGRGKEIYAQYQQASQFSGVSSEHPSEKLQNLYKQIIQVDQSSGSDINAIRRALMEDEPKRGALVCDYAILKDIYHLLIRCFSRTDNRIFLGTMIISSGDERPVEPMVLDSAMNQLLHAMLSTLRLGDTITRYTPSQYVLLLPSVNHETGRIVMERIRSIFCQQYMDSTLTLTYKLCAMEPGGAEA